jgi:hypothetical protein
MASKNCEGLGDMVRPQAGRRESLEEVRVHRESERFVDRQV